MTVKLTSAPNVAAAAERTLREAIRRAPALAEPWNRLADLLSAQGRGDEAGTAYLRALQLSARDPGLVAAAAALAAGRLHDAHALLKPRLAAEPTNLAVLRMMAEVATRTGHHIQAARMLAHALALAPDFNVARRGLAEALYRAEAEEALAEVDAQLARKPDSRGFLNLRAALLDRAGRYEEALAIYERMLAVHPHDAVVWTAAGHMLKTLGRRQECVAAHRRSVALRLGGGESWWALADLKTAELSSEDVAELEATLSDLRHGIEDRALMQFALGGAREQLGDWEGAFTAYVGANASMRAQIRHDPGELPRLLAESAAVFTPGFFADRADWGVQDSAPIFIVGMPRSGSTLLEQMLASHSAVDGTMELDVLPRLVGRIDAAASRKGGPLFPRAAATLARADVEQLGRAYLAAVAPHRRGAPFVIDKRPENFAYAGLLKLILPKATIIDVRRSPMACCMSLFRQHFARGRAYSYALEDLGATYRAYVDLMDHWDHVLPDAVVGVPYERLVAKPETELRRVLDAIGLAFDPACLRFHDNRRAVRTPSAEQVRRPLNAEGIAHWRHFEPWLSPLKEALGPLAEGDPTGD